MGKSVRYFKTQSRATQPVMGDLSSGGIYQTRRPFIQRGVDYCGPYRIKDGPRRSKRTKKIYIAIFVCFGIKAIPRSGHGFNFRAFIATLQRFVSRRRLVTDLYSYNGTNYFLAKKKLRKLQQLIQEESVSSASTTV